ncbi:MAG TPA: hypothetical protein VF149_05670, partial [Bacillales bacterium]
LDYRPLPGYDMFLSLKGQHPVPAFDDHRDYSETGFYKVMGADEQLKSVKATMGVKLPEFGLKIHVAGQSKDMSVGRIHIQN